MRRMIPQKSSVIAPIIQEFKSELSKLYGDRLKQLVLFGSYARGNPHAESDIDILLVLNKMENPLTEIDFVADLKFNFILKYNVLISCIHTTSENFENLDELLFYNIKKEGIVL